MQAPDGRVWVAWTEKDAGGTLQVRVARRDGTAWHEVVGGARPINIAPSSAGSTSGFEPRIGFSNGTPYVAYVQDNPVESVLGAVRLKADGSAWECVDPPGGGRAANPQIAASGGQPTWRPRT